LIALQYVESTAAHSAHAHQAHLNRVHFDLILYAVPKRCRALSKNLAIL
jgi:hypothetical protein